MVSSRQIQMHIAVTSARAFSSGGISYPCLTYSAQTSLHRQQDLVRQISGQLSQASGERLRFYEYHTVVYTTL